MTTPNAEDVARAVAALAAINPSAMASLAASARSSTPATASLPQFSVPGPVAPGASKYNQLLAVIEEMGKDVRPSYTGNRNCAERLKRTIIHARVLVRECLHEIERNSRQPPNQQQ
ncbi:Cyclin-dependent kinase 2-associated protein 2 [Aphelenchoides besseyi]|nr:Cyclin-dependent kinase 2-associated protein 2 [Aphelenchoides besseyi]KAI6210561.1 Cyclin-dependent kinase 2-associated protein 2 [Aphelenchoides besseyi]